MDSLEECSHSTDPTISSLSVSCIVSFLRCLQTVCSGDGFSQENIIRINQLYKSIEDAEFEGFDVRPNKTVCNQINDENQLDLEALQERIKGFDAKQEINEKNEDEANNIESKSLNVQELKRDNLRNFKVESYRSKLSEILKSGSSESNLSQDLDEEKHSVNQSQEKNEPNSQQISDERSDNNEEIEIVTNNETSITLYEEVDDNPRSAASSISGNTEGPEFEDAQEELPKSVHDLLGTQKDEDQTWIQEICENDKEAAHQEREMARAFFKSLKRFLPTLLSLRSSIETDEGLQAFASNYCKGSLIKSC